MANPRSHWWMASMFCHYGRVIGMISHLYNKQLHHSGTMIILPYVFVSFFWR